MTNKDFLEALSEICSDPEYDNKFNNKKKKMKNTAKAVIVCAAALAAVIGAVLLFKSVSAKRGSRKTESIVYVMNSGNYEITELSYLNHIKNTSKIDSTAQKERTVEAYGSIIHATYRETMVEDMHYKIHVYDGFDENGNKVLLHYSVKGEREILTKYAKMKSNYSDSINIQQLSRDECYAIALETVKSLPVDISGIDVSLSNESIFEPNSNSNLGIKDRIKLTRYIFSFEWTCNDIVYYSAAITIYSDGDITVVDCAPSQDDHVTSILTETSTIDSIAEKKVIDVAEKIEGVLDYKCIGKCIVTTPEGKKYIEYVYSFSKTDNYIDYTSDVLVFIPL